MMKCFIIFSVLIFTLSLKFPAFFNQTRARVPSLERLGETKSPFDHVDLYRDYTGVRSRVPGKGQEVDVVPGTLDQLNKSRQDQLEGVSKFDVDTLSLNSHSK